MAAFGATTAANYAISGLIDWPLEFVFILGGLAGSAFGSMAAKRLSEHKGMLTVVFATLIFMVATYVQFQSVEAT